MGKVTGVMTRAKEKMSNAQYAMAATMTVALGEAMTPCAALAADGIFGKVSGALDTVKSGIVGLATPLYGLVAVICLVMILASSGQKAEKAKDWLLRATIAFVLILSLTALVTFIEGLGD